jgi:membrane-associated phospholipid phosphatase
MFSDDGNPDVVRPIGLGLGLLASVGLLAWTTAVAAGGVPTWEERLFDRGNQLADWMEPVLWAPMQIGNLLAPPLVALVAWMAWHKWRPAVGAVVVGLLVWLSSRVLKDVVARGRPSEVLDEIVWRGGTPTSGFGFVSGHAAVAFGLATALCPYQNSPLRLVAYLLAVLVAVARVHVAAHLPLDVLGGAALGVAVGLAYHLIVGIDARSGERTGRVRF